MYTPSAAKLPEGFTADQMVTFPVNAFTSFAALFHQLGFGYPTSFEDDDRIDFSGESILIVGGGSNVGKLAIQLAKIIGIGKILVIASASRRSELEGMGATLVIDRHGSESHIKSQIEEYLGGEGLDKIYDCVSWDFTFPLSLLSKEGKSTLLTLHPAEEAMKIVKENGMNARLQFILGNPVFVGEELGNKFWVHLPRWVKEGKLLVGNFRVIEGLGKVQDIEDGLKSYADGSAVVPVIIHP